MTARQLVAAVRRAIGSRRQAGPARTTLRTATAIPGWVIRLLIMLFAAVAGTGVASTEPQWAVVAAVAVLLAVNPHGALVPVGVAVLAAMLALSATGAGWQLPALLLGSHAVVALAPVATATSWRGRVELAVLRDLLPSFLGVQLVAQAAGLGARVLQGAGEVPWLVVVAVAALGGISWLLTRQLTRRPPPTSRSAALERDRRRYFP
ncbi:hypothetical protein [Georgenia sunbinii]|uniref:hypothetical protein n=1 Tax=Georgenia sunbinii TaxID=3117728 RepID=UPI002F26CECE